MIRCGASETVAMRISRHRTRAIVVPQYSSASGGSAGEGLERVDGYPSCWRHQRLVGCRLRYRRRATFTARPGNGEIRRPRTDPCRSPFYDRGRSGRLAPLVTVMKPSDARCRDDLRGGRRPRCHGPPERGVLVEAEMSTVFVEVGDVGAGEPDGTVDRRLPS